MSHIEIRGITKNNIYQIKVADRSQKNTNSFVYQLWHQVMTDCSFMDSYHKYKVVKYIVNIAMQEPLLQRPVLFSFNFKVLYISSLVFSRIFMSANNTVFTFFFTVDDAATHRA